MDEQNIEARRARIKASQYHYVEADPGAPEGSLLRLRAESVEARLRLGEAWKELREARKAGTLTEDERLRLGLLLEQVVITTRRIREVQELAEK